MKPMTLQCLLAAGIRTVIWIDDYFAPRTRDELVIAIHEYILKWKDAGHAKVDILPFDSLVLTGQKTTIQDSLDEILENMPEEAVRDAANALANLTGIALPNIKPQADDLSSDDFEALEVAFGNGLRTFYLGTWTSSGAQEFATASSDTLFLIDKEYKRESPGFDGTTILKDLVTKTNAFCVMLTHTWAEGEQEERRVDIAKNLDLPPHRFCVLSKRQNPSVPIDPRFARAIRAVMTHRFNGEIAYTVSKTIQISAVETASALTAQAVSDLERVLFQNAEKEGVYEYDAVLRIFEIEQKHALNAALAKDGIQRQLQLSRKFREATEKLCIDHIPGDMRYFRDIRSREVFSEGTGLNKLHSPLACGDVFETEHKERYVLIAQPCDLMMRKNGERRAEVGMFALISESKKPDVADPDDADEMRPAPDYRFYDLKDAFGAEKKSLVDFQKLFVVNLAVLDFAVFNADGAIQLRDDQPDPSIVLSKGWDQAFKTAKRRAFPKNKPAVPLNFGMGKRSAKLMGTVSGNIIGYPLRRIGRLQSATATAVLAAWATFQTRAAFDHDFAEEMENESLATGQQASAVSEPVEFLAVGKTENVVGSVVVPAIASVPGPALADQPERAKPGLTDFHVHPDVAPTKANGEPNG